MFYQFGGARAKYGIPYAYRMAETSSLRSGMAAPEIQALEKGLEFLGEARSAYTLQMRPPRRMHGAEHGFLRCRGAVHRDFPSDEDCNTDPSIG